MSRKISQKQDQILCRRALVKELRAKGFTERQMAERLGIPRSTIGLDLRIMKRQAATDIDRFIEHDLPHEAELLLENTNALLRVAWASLDEDVQMGKPPYPAIASIIQILNLKEELLDDKLQVATFHSDSTESKRIDFEEQAMREAYERERHRSQAVF